MFNSIKLSSNGIRGSEIRIVWCKYIILHIFIYHFEELVAGINVYLKVRINIFKISNLNRHNGSSISETLLLWSLQKENWYLENLACRIIYMIFQQYEALIISFLVVRNNYQNLRLINKWQYCNYNCQWNYRKIICEWSVTYWQNAVYNLAAAFWFIAVTGISLASKGLREKLVSKDLYI